jgi:hypothetical protein
VNARKSRHLALSLLCAWWLAALEGCTHYIHVTPAVPASLTGTIDQTLRVEVPLLALQGPDRMPGIALLEWPAADLRQAITDYATQRGTFLVGSDDQGAFTLSVKTWLWLRSRDAYRYTVHLEADLGPTGKPPAKSYVVEKETVGSRIRWTTASDQDPIATAVQAALDDLFTQIEADAALYRKR